MDWLGVLLLVLIMALVVMLVLLKREIDKTKPADSDLVPLSAVTLSEDKILSDIEAILAEQGDRYEVVLTDWVDEGVDDEMRWRWSVWDADRYVKSYLDIIYNGVGGCLMLGNAPSRAEAESQALAWLKLHRGDSAVIL